MYKAILACVLSSIFLTACEEPAIIPKPRTYPRVEFPARQYQTFVHSDCSYKFETPNYSIVEQDSVFFNEKAPNNCWINIKYPIFNGQLYCSYYPVRNREELDKFITDGHTIANKHTIKADYIEELLIDNGHSVYGTLFNIEGPAASGIQFYLTDSTRHFFKASLYFNETVNPDSIAPVLEFMKHDINHMLETFRWEAK
jgi:gliding motility-associated lipoprotein GldD